MPRPIEVTTALYNAGHLGDKARRIARRNRATLVNSTENGGRVRVHWFTVPCGSDEDYKEHTRTLLAALQVAGADKATIRSQRTHAR